MTTRREKSETTCIIQPDTAGVPSFISRESVIAYKYAREMNNNQLSGLICEGSRIPKCYFPADILLKIQQGGIASRQLPKIYKKALKRFLGVV